MSMSTSVRANDKTGKARKLPVDHPTINRAEWSATNDGGKLCCCLQSLPLSRKGDLGGKKTKKRCVSKTISALNRKITYQNWKVVTNYH